MIVPSIDIMNGRAVQLRRGRELVLDGGDPLERLEQFSLAGQVAVVDLDAALGRGSNRAIIEAMVRRAPCRVGGGIRDLDAARGWLDAGARRVVLGTAASPELCRQLPRDRVIAAVDADAGDVVVDGWRIRTGRAVLDAVRELAPVVGGLLLTQVEHEGAMGGFNRVLIERAVAAAPGVRITAAGGITRPEEIHWLDQLGVDAQVGMALYTGRLELADAIAAPLGSGSALWPTVVCDEAGTALGLAWSNRESLRRAVSERRGTYWSRSRAEVWVKGETSGNTQTLTGVDLDCDRDALRFTVRQAGTGFCHTGSWTCWGEGFGLGTLERVIRARAASAPAGSGTARLLSHPGLLDTKLLEEASELAAAKDGAHAAREAADLLYFTLTALVGRGGSLEDLRAELERRHLRVSRRPMRPKDAEAAP